MIVTTTIYRVQHRTSGLGPGGDSGMATAKDRWFDHMYENDLPTPFREALPFNHTFVCGVLTLSGLAEWFPRPILRSLYRDGFRVVAVTLPAIDLHIGRKQVIFPRRYLSSATIEKVYTRFVNIPSSYHLHA